ncbi:CTP synthase [Striga asiatica]|uniref:CTP synthase n=1 Tax=Striga asiatica TaxID=4170 RepID=A0A5A7PPY8_STRAF|nr:CTP synthase [Striga asiatica]
MKIISIQTSKNQIFKNLDFNDSEAVKVSAAAEAKRMKNKKNKQRKQKKKKGGLCEKGDEGPESIPNFCHETCSCVPINIICFILFLIILLDQVTLSNDC